MSLDAIDRRREEAAARAWSVAVAPLDEASLSAWPSNRERQRGYVFQTREFLAVWASTIAPARDGRVYLATVRDETGAAALWLPLAIERRQGVRALCFADGGVADANAPILGPGRVPTGKAFAAVWRDILSALPPVDLIDLAKMPETIKGEPNPMMDLATVPHGTRLHENTRAEDPDPAVRLRDHRAKLAQAARKLAREAPVATAWAADEAQAEQWFEALVAYKRKQFIASYGYDAFEAHDLLGFYRAAFGGENFGRLATIAAERHGDAITAAAFLFASPDRVHYVLPAYDAERYGATSPGARLMAHLVDRAVAEGWDFDLGEGDGAYKSRWTTASIALRDHEAGVTLSGRLYLAARRLARLERFAAARARVKRWLWA